jgi:surface-anchored protein
MRLQLEETKTMKGLTRSMGMVAMLAIVLALPSAVRANGHDRLDYTAGHADIGFGYHGGVWEPHLHAHAGATIGGDKLGDDAEFHPGEIRIVVPQSVYGASDAYDFFKIPQSLGLNEGDAFWNLPQSGVSGAPFLGIGSHIHSGIFENDLFRIQLTAFSGPGEFSLWFANFGNPDESIAFQTLGGLSAADTIHDISIHEHSHWNWSFSEPGDYALTLTAIGDFADGSGVTFGSGTFHFQVLNHVPEPGTFGLALVGLGCLVATRRRRTP